MYLLLSHIHLILERYTVMLPYIYEICAFLTKLQVLQQYIRIVDDELK